MPIFPEDPADLHPDEHGLVALGGRLTPEIVVEAYGKGIFPWTGRHPIPWYSPDPRMVLFPSEAHVSRSLQKVIRRGTYEIRIDTAYTTVMERCAKQPRPGQDGTWITKNMIRTYSQLNEMGVTHSVEAWLEGELVGGLYGVAIGRAFFGESMFSEAPNASKVALIALCRRLEARQYRFIDCQQETPHLANMGAKPISRETFLKLLKEAVSHPDAWA